MYGATLLAAGAAHVSVALPSAFAVAIRFCTKLKYAAVIVLLDSTYPEPAKLFVLSAVVPNVFSLAVEKEFALTPLYTEEPLFQLFANWIAVVLPLNVLPETI